MFIGGYSGGGSFVRVPCRITPRAQADHDRLMKRFPDNACMEVLNRALLAGFPLPAAHDPAGQQVNLGSEFIREGSAGHWEWDLTHPDLAGEIDPDEPDVDPLGVRVKGQLLVHSRGGGEATAEFHCYSMREIISQFRINGVL